MKSIDVTPESPILVLYLSAKLQYTFSVVREHNTSETADALAAVFKLTVDERKALLPSGVQQIFANRLAWAKSHLKMAGLLESPKRGVFKITERGLDVLAKRPSIINLKYLFQFPEYVQFSP
jgi:restriction system protein